MLRRAGIGIALLAALAVVALYLAGGESGRRTAATRPGTAAPEAPEGPAAPEPPPDTVPKHVARILVLDPGGTALAGAVVARSDLPGEPVTTGADGRCVLPLPGSDWCEITVRHPDFVLEKTWVRAQAEEFEILLDRGARLVVLVLDPLRKPVAGASVSASWTTAHGAAGIWRWSHGEDLGAFRTAEDGRAAIGPVPEATIVLRVDHAPFALLEDRLDVVSDAPIEHVLTLDAGGLLLGRVLGPGGEGVPGATVKVANLARPVATSGPGGAFRLEGVAPGPVEVVAEAEGYGPGFFGAALGWGDPVPIQLRTGETIAGLEILLSKPVYVRGRIVDELGKPVEGVTVQAYIRHGFALGRGDSSGEEGRFRVGPYSVSEPGQAWIWFSSPRHTIEQVSAEAEPGKDVDVGEVKATRRATVRGVLVGTDGHPVEGRVEATTGDNDGRTIQASKPDGTFEILGVGPGDVTLVADRIEEPVLKSRPLVLPTTGGQEIDGVEIVLLATKPIRGRVITPDGRPRPGAILGIRPHGGPAILDQEWTDADGKFAFESLSEGEYDVGIVGSGSVWWGIKAEFHEDPAPVKAEAGREDLEFIFPLKGGIILGKVVAKDDGRPLKGFDATFIKYKLFIPTDTDMEMYTGDGTFRYETSEPGTWQVDISATGYASHRTDKFSLAAGEVKELGTIRLGPGGTIAGTVLDAQQQPVPYARINILNEKLQTNEDEPFTDLEGRFTVVDVSPGVYNVFAVSPRHPIGLVRAVTVREGERTEVQVLFVEPAPLTIEVRDPSGQPVEGAALDFTFPAVAPLTSKLFRNKIPPGYGSHKSDAQGTILQPCLPPGEVTITIEASGFEPATKKLELRSGQANRIEIRLRRDGG
jgi:protocatechuate 3,4-dioxygenase beta subunit